MDDFSIRGYTEVNIVGTKLTSVNMEVSGLNRVIVETNTVPFGSRYEDHLKLVVIQRSDLKS